MATKRKKDEIKYSANEELRTYRTGEYVINDKIIIKSPTLAEICDYGEHSFLSAILNLTMTSSDCIYELSQVGIDWEEIDDMSMFAISVANYDEVACKMLFKNLSFADFERKVNLTNGEIYLEDTKHDIIIDRNIQSYIATYFRKLLGLKYNRVIAGNERTKKVLIDDAKREFERSKRKKVKSFFKPLISGMVNSDGFKYTYENIWDIRIDVFMDCVRRIQLIKDTDNLLRGIYSGNVDNSSIKQDDIDWIKNI